MSCAGHLSATLTSSNIANALPAEPRETSKKQDLAQPPLGAMMESQVGRLRLRKTEGVDSPRKLDK